MDKYISTNKHWVFIIVAILVAFFLTRLINLTIIPIFTDEAIYLRWAQIAAGDARWRFISLIDGKQPLLIWLFIPIIKLGLFTDPLFAGRLVSVMLGFVAMTGMYAFGWYLTRNIRGGVVGAVLYLTIPFFLMYDRLAIYEALLTAITVWTLFLSYLLGKTLRLDVALLLGTAIGFGFLTKSSAIFFLLLLPVTLLLVDWGKRRKRRKLFKWMGLAMVVVVQSQIYANILRLSEFRHYVGQKNLQFVYSLSEFISEPFKSFYGNLVGLTTWLVTYATLPFFLVILVTTAWLIRKNIKQAAFFLTYFIVPFVALAFFGKVIYPRFVLFMFVPLVLPVILFINHYWKSLQARKYVWLALIIGLLPIINFHYRLLFDPIHAPMPLADRQQLINDWPSGYGIKEVVAYLEAEAEKGPIVVGTEGTFGLFPMALELYLGTNKNVTFKALWPLNEFPSELAEDAKAVPTYLLFKERQTAPDDWPIELVEEYQRGNGPTYLRFYRVVP